MLMKKLESFFVHVPKTGGTTIKNIFETITTCIIPEWHMSCSEFHQFLTPKEFKSYFKFAFIRNPWDRVVSVYHFKKYIKTIPSKVSFKQWVESNPLDWDVRSQLNFLKGVDFIGKYEKFEEDLKKIGKILNINLPQIPHLNQSPHEHYYKYYDKKTIKIVEEWNQEDIMYFKYKFHQHKWL